MRRIPRLLAPPVVAALLLAFPAAAALSAPAPVPAVAQEGEEVAVDIIDFDFDPNPIEANVGDTVTWTNTGARPHTATDRGGTFDTDPIAPGDSKSVKLTVPGRYQFFCRINPAKMNGEIVVRAGDEPAEVTRVEAFDEAREGKKLSFGPDELEVAAGSTLLLANVGGKPHTLTADDGSFDTGVVTPGAEGGRFAGKNATITLNQPGEFPFHCEVHPAAMKGTITVTGEEPAEGEAAGPSEGSSAPTSISIDMQDNAFDPAEISVAPGGEVTWRNTGQAPHTATFDDIPLDTETIDAGGDASLTAPEEPGSYSYKCNIHPAQMRAVLVVVGEGIEDPTEQAAPGGEDDDGGGGGGGGGDAGAAGDAAAGGGGPGGVSLFALTTGVLGAFAAGFGISAFVRGRPDRV